MDEKTIITLTREKLPSLAESLLEVFPLPGGGSDRRYYRIRHGSGSIIFSEYNKDRHENNLFAQQSDFLARHQVPVPHIIARDLDKGRLWLEDLGDTDLWSYRKDDWHGVSRPLYETTIGEVSRIHRLLEDELKDPPVMDLPFDADLYRWEQLYFLEYFAKQFSSAGESEILRVRDSQELKNLREGLAALPRCLIHRDFQSQNVMIREGRPVFIDYQGLRFGRAEYDLASLIFDPYVLLSLEQCEDLIEFAEARSSNPDFRDVLMRCAAQRLMQALGAYGYLGIVKQKTSFLTHIQPAIANLYEVAVRRQTLPIIAPLLKLRDDFLEQHP